MMSKFFAVLILVLFPAVALAAVTVDISGGPQTINLVNGSTPLAQIVIAKPSVILLTGGTKLLTGGTNLLKE